MYKQMKHLPLLSIFLVFIPVQLSAGWPSTELRYVWGPEITNDDFISTLNFSPEFKFGIGDSAFQTEGVEGPNGKTAQNNWTAWEHKKDENDEFLIKNDQTIGNACERWNRYKEDIQLIADSGFDIYRFSVEWSKIEPECGVFDAEAMQQYLDVVDEVLAQGLQPIATLFHHTWPTWFGEMDGFENPEALKHFEEYCVYVFEHLHEKVKTWIILNEPAAYAIEGFFRGEYPPGKHDLNLAGIALNNMLIAHVNVYGQCKKIDNSVHIGIAKVFHPLDPYHPWNPLEQAACKFFSWLTNDVTLEYFKSGTFYWGLPGKALSDFNSQAPYALDFLGINYYAHTILTTQWSKKPLGPTHRPGEELTDDGKIVYPEGLMRSIEKAAELNLPMYIMENGLADKNDRLRKKFINQHLKIVALALEKDYDIRGYFYWTLLDNFEWRKGYDEACYGLFACDRQTQQRTLRESAKPFIEFLQQRKKDQITID